MSESESWPEAEDRPQPARSRRPVPFSPAAAESLAGGVDPAQRIEAAHLTAEVLVTHGRAGDDERAARLIALADGHGIDDIAELWSDRPGDTLPGALWRLYALRAGIRSDPEGLARAYEAGRIHAPVHEVIAGVEAPPGQAELLSLADAVLTGAFRGDLDVALERAGAFCRVVSTGLAMIADQVPELDSPMPLSADPGVALTRRAADLQRTAGELERAAARWRQGELR
jgi:hypothetical protein